MLCGCCQLQQGELPVVNRSVFRSAWDYLAGVRPKGCLLLCQMGDIPACGAFPVVCKAEQTLGYNGPAQLDKGIPPVGTGRCIGVFQSDIEASEIRLLAIDDNQFAVVAVVDTQEGTEPESAAVE